MPDLATVLGLMQPQQNTDLEIVFRKGGVIVGTYTSGRFFPADGMDKEEAALAAFRVFISLIVPQPDVSWGGGMPMGMSE